MTGLGVIQYRVLAFSHLNLAIALGKYHHIFQRDDLKLTDLLNLFNCELFQGKGLGHVHLFMFDS